MKKQTALLVILVLSIAGMLFSGYLTWGEYIKSAISCGSNPAGCPLVSSSLFGLPVCVYGFLMYLAVFIFALLGIFSKK